MAYKISIVDITPGTCRIEDLKEKSCFIGISIENPNFQPKYAIELLKWVESNFRSCILVIADYVYRYSLQIKYDITAKQAEIQAEERGKEFYSNYLELITNSQFNFQLYRWQDPQVAITQKYIDDISDIIIGNTDIEKDIESEARSYLSRQRLELSTAKDERYEKYLLLSRKYILEEMAFINSLVSKSIDISVYPGVQLKVLKNLSSFQYSKLALPIEQTIYVDLKVKK